MYKESFFFTYFSVNNFYLSSNKVFLLRFVKAIPHTAGALCAVGQKQAKAPAYRLFHKICVTLQAERNTEFMRLSPTGPWRPFLLLLPTCLALIGMRYMPQVYIGPYEVKGVDLLADVMPDEQATQAGNGGHGTAAGTSSTANVDGGNGVTPEAARSQAARDTCPAGIVCFEDYSDHGPHGMDAFYAALKTRHTLGRPVRVAYFGDSFIEGDLITDHLRRLMQDKWGGCGVGFVDIASEFIALRPTLRHKAEGWTEYNVMQAKHNATADGAISGRCARAGGGAWAEYAAVRGMAHLDSFSTATLYLTAAEPGHAALRTNGSTADTTLAIAGHKALEALTLTAPMRQVRFTVPAQTVCYGMALEGSDGIVVDNFSLRGSSGMQLTAMSEEVLTQWHRVRPYDMIILQYGLNVANNKQTNYSAYANRMSQAVQHLKKGFPQTAIVIVGVGDRENRENGQLTTMRSIFNLMDAQQSMAAENGVVFWNLYEAMGGEGSIRRMAESEHPEAAKDYTHINRRGGQRVATAMFRSILHGWKNYNEHTQ